jgi:hypothetical protein
MRWRRIGIGAGVVLLAIQLVPVPRENPPIDGEVPADPAVRAILERACYDCHSHEVRWPWYGYVAPVSWLLAYDVHHAREHLNFSTWNAYDDSKRRKKLEDAWEEVEEGEMPLFFYVWLHPDAALDEGDRATLRAWTRAE